MNSQEDVLNIDNYTNVDLKNFLKLDSTRDYTMDEIDQKADEMTEKLILKNSSSNVEEKKKMLKFIQLAKEKIKESSRVNLDNILDIKSSNGPTTKFSNPIFSNEPHFVQDIYSISNRNPNTIDIQYRTRLFVFNTKFSDEFLYESSPTFLKGDTTGALDFTFTLVNPVKNVIGVNLSALQYPNVQPTFSLSKNNVFMYISVVGGVEGLVQMDNGYFSSDKVSFVLEQRINIALYGQYYAPSVVPVNAITPPYVVNFNNPFAVIISPYTHRISIINTQNELFKIVFDMPIWDLNQGTVCLQKTPFSSELPEYYAQNRLQPNTLGFQLGFRNVIYETPFETTEYDWGNSAIKPVREYTGDSQYEDNNGGYVYFCMNEFATNGADDVTGVFQNYFFNNNVLALVPITSPHFAHTLTDGSNFIFKARNYLGPIDISKIVVSIYNENGVKISFNQVPFSFALEFKTLADNPSTIDRIQPRYVLHNDTVTVSNKV